MMMVKTSPLKIVIIHDDLETDDPLVEELRARYGPENVVLKKESQEGLDYVLANLTDKIIVILDYQFKSTEPSGLTVFEKIRERTSLVYIIIWTANTVTAVGPEDLVKFINNDALAFISSTDDSDRVLEIVEKAAHELDRRVGSVIEQWITRQPDELKNAAYVTTETGKQYSLNKILEEIRHETSFGKQVEKNILLLAVDLLTRQKEKLND